MNTVLNRCRALMSRKSVHVLAEVLCLIAIAAAFLVVSPLAQARRGNSGGGGGGCCGNCNNACAQAAGNKSSAAAPKKSVLFNGVITDITQTGPQSPTVSNMVAQLSKVFVLNKQNQWAWVTVTLPVNGKTANFMGEAFFGNRNAPIVELAEIEPPSDPNDPALLAILNKHQLYNLKGLTGSSSSAGIL